MCCFTGPVTSVSATKIFARMGDRSRQYLVYSMNVDAPKELAMVLPIPVAAGSDEKAVRFINLEKYPTFFEDMEAGFPVPPPRSKGQGITVLAAGRDSAPLPVFQVGSFEASFVPTVADFDRLDERFRLPAGTFDKLTGYKQFGFAVFKLKPGAQKIHPMAFEFPTALMSHLFFPTVHIHDGKVHTRAGFDHVLYCQSAANLRVKVLDWRESDRLAEKFVDTKKAEGIVLAKEHCFRRELRGSLPNEDTILSAAN